MFKRGTPEEQEAKRQEKAAAAEARAAADAGLQRKKEQDAFRRSPAGRARAAFARGDGIFQLDIDVKNTEAIVIAMVGASTTTRTADPLAVLNSVCREGWEIVSGSFVFHELGSESRDKFLSSGQHIAVTGTVIGYYVFRRCEANRVTGDESSAPTKALPATVTTEETTAQPGG
jgi:hypothetical protein